MNRNVVKKWCSYLTEIHIETVDSDINGELNVYLKNGRYQLSADDAVYSYDDKYENFKQCFKKLNIGDRKIENVLLLGFGMGSIPYILEKIFHKKYVYTGIELDPNVIYLASKYTLPRLESEIQLYQTDALHFVKSCQEKYDLICLDVFVQDQIPDQFLTQSFLKDTKHLLNKNGIVISNHIAWNQENKSKAEEYYSSIFCKVFTNGQKMEAHKNLMVVGVK